MLQSGIIPYEYDFIYPWKIPPSGFLGYSGIAFEQDMFVILAEVRRYLGPNAFENGSFNGAPSGLVFQLYQNISGIPGRGSYPPMGFDRSSYGFEPTSSGVNLVRGQVNTTDWIQDLRQALSGFTSEVYNGLFATITEDCAAGTSYQDCWLQAKNGYTNWAREYYNHPGSPSIGTLGFSGVLYDKDLDEVLFQPFPRFSTLLSSSISGLTIIITSPVFPAFTKTDGTLITPTPRDRTIDFSLYAAATNRSYFNYSHITSGVLRLDGDVLSSGTVYDFNGSLGTYIINGLREFPQGPHDTINYPTINRAFITAPAANSVTPLLVSRNSFPPSGNPVSQFPAPANVALTSGIEHFNDSLFISTKILDPYTVDFYGFRLLSPVSKNVLYIKFGNQVDQPNSIDLDFNNQSEIVVKRDIHRFDSNTIIGLSGVERTNSTVTTHFAQYNNDLNLTNPDIPAVVTLGTSTIIPNNTATEYETRPPYHFWIDNNMSQLYTYNYILGDRGITSNSGLIIRYDLPSFTNGTPFMCNPVREGGADSSVDPRVDFFGNNQSSIGITVDSLQFVAVREAGGIAPALFTHGFSLISFIQDGTDYNLFSFGPFEPIDGTDAGFAAGTMFMPMHIEVITGATSFNNGVWGLFDEFVSGGFTNRRWLMRIVREGSSWIVREFYGNQRTSIDTSPLFPTGSIGRNGDFQYILKFDL